MLLATTERERRASARWTTRRTLRWRAQRSRRVRTSPIIERSLNGLAIQATIDDRLHVGAWLFPADEETAVRHGFRSAIVRRLGNDGLGQDLMYVEILA